MTTPPQNAQAGFGEAVAMSDGVEAVGIPYLNVGSNLAQGAVDLYDQVNGQWTYAQQLVASDAAAKDTFGIAVAMSGDLLVACGRRADGPAVYVFTKTGTSWAQTAEVPTQCTPNGTAASIAISGKTFVVGDPASDNNRAFVFAETASGWTKVATLYPAPGAPTDNRFGWNVAISKSRIAIGAVDGPGAAIYIYDLKDGRWVRTATAVQGDQAGGTLALANNVLLATSVSETDVLVDSSGHWAQTATLAGGAVVALSKLTAVIADPTVGLHGTGYVYQEGPTGWEEIGSVMPPASAPSGHWFGSAIAVDGTSAVVGAYFYANEYGAAFQITGIPK